MSENTNKYYQSRCYSLKEALDLVRQNNFKVENVTTIVHIPTPFNKLAKLLNKSKLIFFNDLVKCCIEIFSKMSGGGTKFLTGWFIALKLVKN